ncbi:hypothetical protein EST38_g9397 [Candolleomyces aberdarensis]|uniref:Mid2 domain-containing protein n=1 Tax=Candolleomyces aberdarensis TaxID=2316362 RepID=A0A4V1Q2W1_9AGAR|nr:hypothetical protein EST38_g9397 [Candolleomyces aberdarensis]
MAPDFLFIFSFLFVISAQVVSCQARLTFTFTDGVQQCQPSTLLLAGDPIDEAQSGDLTLTILPLDSAPIVVPLTRLAATTRTISLTALPLSAGTRFIASLDDGSGRSTAQVSQLTTVLPGPVTQAQGNSSDCLPTGVPVSRRFVLLNNPNQCEEFTIQYNTSLVAKAPRVRLFEPNGISLALDSTSDNTTAGEAKYIMSVSQNKKVMFLIDGSNGIRETTSLISGGESSSEECLQAEKAAEAQLGITPTSGVVSKRTIIIGAASGGGAVVLIALAMVIFIIYDRKKKRRRRELASFDGSRMFQSSNEKGFQRSNLAETSRIRTGSVVDPTYTSVPLEPVNQGNITPTRTPVDTVPTLPYGRLQMSPDPQQQSPESGHHLGRPSIALSETRNVDPQTNYEADRLSLTSLDIEGMLNMAMQQSEGRSREGSIPMVLFGGSQDYSANPAISSSAVLPSPSPETPLCYRVTVLVHVKHESIFARGFGCRAGRKEVVSTFTPVIWVTVPDAWWVDGSSDITTGR